MLYHADSYNFIISFFCMRIKKQGESWEASVYRRNSFAWTMHSFVVNFWKETQNNWSLNNADRHLQNLAETNLLFEMGKSLPKRMKIQWFTSHPWIYYIVKEEIFVGEKFRTFPYKKPFAWKLISYIYFRNDKETIKWPASPVEENLVWKLIVYFFQCMEATKLNSLQVAQDSCDVTHSLTQASIHTNRVHTSKRCTKYSLHLVPSTSRHTNVIMLYAVKAGPPPPLIWVFGHFWLFCTMV